MSIEHGPNPEERDSGEGRFQYAAESVPSERHPRRNEDAYVAVPERGAFAVLDGVSGQFETGEGKIGSRTAADSLYQSIRKLSRASSLAERQQQALGLLDQAHAAVQAVRREKKVDGAKTTAALGLIHREGNRAFLVADSIGDCRIYVLRHHGGLEPITIDDHILTKAGGDQVRARQLQQQLSEVASASELPPDERQVFINRNDPSQRLGDSQELRHQPRVAELYPGDRIVLTSDGVHDNLRDSEMEKIVTTAETPEAASSGLIRAAAKRSREQQAEGEFSRAKPDDMTTVVVEVKP